MIDGRIYLFGGWRAGLRLTRVYDPETDSWTLLAPIPVEYNYGHATAVVDGEVYVIGGASDDVSVYNPQTDSWRRAASIPISRRSLAAGTISGRIYVVGTGETLQVYDPGTGS